MPPKVLRAVAVLLLVGGATPAAEARPTRDRRSADRRDRLAPQQLAFVSATWSGFGQPYARARVTVTGNGGFRASGTVTAYRRLPDCHREYWVYTRITLRLDGEKPTSHVWRPDTCSTQASPDTSGASSDPG